MKIYDIYIYVYILDHPAVNIAIHASFYNSEQVSEKILVQSIFPKGKQTQLPSFTVAKSETHDPRNCLITSSLNPQYTSKRFL